MSNENKTFTEKDIHYFICSEGREWAHMPWGMIEDGCRDRARPTTLGIEAFRETNGLIPSLWVTYPNVDEEPFAIAPADRIEVVTEHVEATIADALQALLDNGGKPVMGWEFSSHHTLDAFGGTLSGAVVGAPFPFYARSGHAFTCCTTAFRPVTRVRIKEEVKQINTREVPDGVTPLPEDEPWLAYVGKGIGKASGGQEPWCYTNTGDSIYSGWDNASGRGYYPLLNEDWHYAIDVRHSEAQERFPDVCKAHGYVEPMPEPKFKEPLTAETVEQAFSKYWQVGSEHRAIDAFRAGAAWAKEVQGE